MSNVEALEEIRSEIENLKEIIKNLELLFKNHNKYKDDEFINLKTKYCSLISNSLKTITSDFSGIVENNVLKRWVSEDLKMIEENNTKLLNSDNLNFNAIEKLCSDITYRLIRLESSRETILKH